MHITLMLLQYKSRRIHFLLKKATLHAKYSLHFTFSEVQFLKGFILENNCLGVPLRKEKLHGCNCALVFSKINLSKALHDFKTTIIKTGPLLEEIKQKQKIFQICSPGWL